MSFVRVMLESFDMTSWFLLILLTLALVSVTRRRNHKLPPGPKGLPLLGVLPLLTSRPDKKIKEWADEYGEVMTLPLINNRVVVINSMEALTEGPVRNGADYANRPWCYMHDVIFARNGISMLDYSQEWKEQRRFILTSMRRFGYDKETLSKKTIMEVKKFCEVMKDLDGNFTVGRHKLIEVGANMISQLCIGHRFDYDDQGFMKFFRYVTKLFSKASLSLQVTVFVPWLHHFPPFRNELRGLTKLFEELHESIYKEMESHRKKKQVVKNGKAMDLTDAYLKELKNRKENDTSLYTYEMLMFTLRDFFIAGTETLASTLTWSILLLCNRRKTVLRKIQQEIDEVVGRENDVKLDDRSKMPYTMAFMHEVFRFRTLLPFAIPIMTTKDTQLGGYVIPKGTTVLENLYAVHNDEVYWEKPEEFRVERHLNDSGIFVKSPNVVPFGVGYRYCLGKTYAEMQYFISLVTILQIYDVAPSSAEHDWQNEDLEESGFVAMAPLDLKVKLVERSD